MSSVESRFNLQCSVFTRNMSEQKNMTMVDPTEASRVETVKREVSLSDSDAAAKERDDDSIQGKSFASDSHNDESGVKNNENDDGSDTLAPPVHDKSNKIEGSDTHPVHDKINESEGSDITPPPVHEISFDDAASEQCQRWQVLPSIKLLFWAIVVWCALLRLVISLERAGVTENITDMRLEQFLVEWANNHNLSSYNFPESQRVGYKLAQEGASVHYPVVLIPGFVTSGLELWAGKPCARSKYFRQRMWGGIGTAKQFFTERDCWREHLALDPFTGMDPEGIRLRSCTGFEAADFFLANYWVWSKLIENLADLGYDGSTMSMMSYDWRLSFPLLEERDGYFTRLKHHIEAMHKTNGRKVVLTAHSMGSPLMVYFFKWVTTDESEGGGGGGSDWVDEHVHAFVNIAGPLLGVPKAAPALLSGEMRDTSLFTGVFGSMIEEFFGRRLRKDLWNTWGSLWAMLPLGGNAVWGVGADMCNSSSSSDGLWCKETDEEYSMTSSAPLIQLTDTELDKAPRSNATRTFDCKGGKSERRQARYLSKAIDAFSHQANHSVEDSLLFLQKWGAGYGPSFANARLHSFDQDDAPSPRTWYDPSRTPLPDAPKMKIYCLYGVGLRTERAYFYKRNTKQAVDNEEPRICNNSHFDPPLVMDTSIDDPKQGISYGVKFTDGDGSVPLLSLGYLCVDAWKRKHLNPSGSEVVTREYPHKPEFLMGDPMRGGSHAADHVDILGNVDMTEDFLRVVSNHGAKKVKTHIVSDIVNISQRIDAHPNGGLNVPKESRQNPIEAFLGLFEKKN